MLYAKAMLRYDPAYAGVLLGFGRHLQVHLIERGHTTFDSRFIPARRSRSSGRLVFHAYLEGEIEADSVRRSVPFLWLTTEEEFYGTLARPAVPLRAGGSRLTKIEVYLPAESWRGAVSTTPLTLDGEPPMIAALEQFAARARELRDGLSHDLDRAVDALLVALAKQGWIGSAALRGRADDETPALTRLWRSAIPSLAVIDLSLSISDLSNRAGVTSRQVTRDVAQLLERIGMPLGFRSIVAEQRVRLAVLFLSSPHARPEEVAAVVGYAGVESMAAAFRDAELPTPGEVLQRLREART